MKIKGTAAYEGGKIGVEVAAAIGAYKFLSWAGKGSLNLVKEYGPKVIAWGAGLFKKKAE